MKTMAIFLLSACTASLALKAQGTQTPPPKRGVFALMDKLSGNGSQASTKGKVPPPPPSIRATTAKHSQRILQSAYGRSYVLTNYKDVSTEQGSQFEAALDTKNGFKGYLFGMSAESFVAEATKRGERFHKAAGDMFSGKDFMCTTPVDKQEINGVPVEVSYAFFKKSLARIVVKPHPSHPDLSAKELQAVYEAFSSSYGPGEEKVLVAKDWKATSFSGCEELVAEDALQKLMSTMLAEGQARGGFRPDQIGENLTFCGYWWSSGAVEINFTTSSDLTEIAKSKAGVWAQNAGEKSFCISLTSKKVLGPYLSEKLASPAGGSKGI